MTFTFGKRSEAELKGVHPDLVAVVRRALELTPIDFGVHDGLRTKEEQAEYFRTGASKTMNILGMELDRIGLGYLTSKDFYAWRLVFSFPY